MSEANAAPTPNNMPGAATPGATDGATPEAAEAAPKSAEELRTELEQWKEQARKNEARAKANAAKAKEYDANFSTYKESHEKLQAELEQKKSPDQRVLDEAEAARKAKDEADARAEQAHAELLRFKLAGELPGFLHGLLTGTTEEEITEQVAVVKGQLDEYIASVSGPRSPRPDPLQGRESVLTGSPRDKFAEAISRIL